MHGKFSSHKFEQLINKGNRTGKKGNHKAAQKYYLEALQETEKSGTDQKSKTIANFKLGASEYRRGNHEAAIPYLLETYKAINEDYFDEKSKLLVLSGLGAFYNANGELQRAEEFLNQAINIERSLRKQGTPYLATNLGLLGSIYSSTSRVSDAIPLIEEALLLMPEQSPFERSTLERLLEKILEEQGNTEKLSALKTARNEKLLERVMKPRAIKREPYDVPRHWPWDNVTEYLDYVFRNTAATAGNEPETFLQFRKIDAQFRVLEENLRAYLATKLASQRSEGKKFSQLVVDNEDWLEIFFLMRAHSSWLSAVGLCAAGQVQEAHMVLRGSVENALYAYRVFRSPKVKKYWFRRDDPDQEVREKAKRCFSIKEISTQMEATDPFLNERSAALYETLIQEGGHPNVQTFWRSAMQENERGQLRLSVSYLDPESAPLQTVIESGEFCLWVFQIVFPEYSAYKAPSSAS